MVKIVVPSVNGNIILFCPAARQENFDSRFCQGTPKAEQKNYLLILPTKAGGAEGIRTPDPHNAIVVLYQLSYDPSRNVHSLEPPRRLSKLFTRPLLSTSPALRLKQSDASTVSQRKPSPAARRNNARSIACGDMIWIECAGLDGIAFGRAFHPRFAANCVSDARAVLPALRRRLG
jgi:hypothetical protein